MKLAFSMPHMLELKATAQPWELAVDGVEATRFARLADQLGFDLISVPEHFVIPSAHVALSGAHYFHAAAAQAYFAGATERIRIGSSVAILPLQHPIATAKALASADWLSGGRIVATFGAGWLEREFEILGVAFHERGRICDEYLAAIIELWTSDAPSFEGRYVSFHDVAFAPRPIARPHTPIWLGGDADGALKRAARFASGWWPFLTKPEDIPARLDFIRSQPDFRNGPFEVVYGLGTARVGEGHAVMDDPAARPDIGLQEIVDRLGRLEALGVTLSSVPIPPVTSADAYADYAHWIIEEVRPRL